MDFLGIIDIIEEPYFLLFVFSLILNVVGMVLVSKYKRLTDELERENLHLESYIYLENYGDEHTKRI